MAAAQTPPVQASATASLASAPTVPTPAATSAPQPLAPIVASAANSVQPTGWFEKDSFSFEFAKTVPTVLVAAFVAYIAWQQARLARRQVAISRSQARVAKEQAKISRLQAETAKAKFRLDLFDRRYEIFEITWRFMSEQIQAGDAVPKATEIAFSNAITKARLLFGPEIVAFMGEAHQKHLALSALARQRSAFVPDEKHIIDSATELDYLHWFSTQTPGLPVRFAPYLGFGSHRDPSESASTRGDSYLPPRS